MKYLFIDSLHSIDIRDEISLSSVSFCSYKNTFIVRSSDLLSFFFLIMSQLNGILLSLKSDRDFLERALKKNRKVFFCMRKECLTYIVFALFAEKVAHEERPHGEAHVAVNVRDAALPALRLLFTTVEHGIKVLL